MYFKDIKNVEFSKIIKNPEDILAHIDKDRDREETLFEHSSLAMFYFNKAIEDKNLDSVFSRLEKNMINKFSDRGIELYKEMIVNIIYLHDIGKINPTFQSKKMGNKIFNKYEANKFNYSNHSMLSSIIYINNFFNKIKKHDSSKEKEKLFALLILNSYVISKHHSKLDSIYDYLEKLTNPDGEGFKLLNERKDIFEGVYIEKFVINEAIIKQLAKGTRYLLKKESNSIIYYIYIRFISSLLLASDYYATSEFMNDKRNISNGNIQDINIFYDEFKNTDIYRWIREYEIEKYEKTNKLENINDINILRNELFLDAERSLLENEESNIYYLEAPTGGGKSNVAFNLSFKMLEMDKCLNKIFYVYPFNTLVEQNMNTLKDVFKDKKFLDNVAVINSVVPIKHDKRYIVDENEMSDISDESYEKSLLDRQFLQYPIVLTTHISLFNFLFGVSKENIFPLYQLANSVVILDEIQSYKNKIWKEIITFLNYYSEVLNIKIIIMSATLPNLNKLFDGRLNSLNLISDREKYFHNTIFKDRVISDFSLIDSEGPSIDLLNHVLKKANESNKNILIEFIKKKSATDFFKVMKRELEDSDRKVELITGDDNRVERNRIIDMVKQNNNGDGNILLIATQVIEAGVDIDMDIGYKDISMLDAEEQFLGRINRSSKNKGGGIVYFFDLDNAGRIYIGDVRKEKHINIRNDKFKEIFINKNFQDFYKYVFDYLDKEAKRINEDSYNSFMQKDVKNLDFNSIQKRMKLIDSRFEYSVFLNRIIEIDDGEILVGEDVWEDYIRLLKDNKMEYAKKRIMLSNVKSKMSYFIYKLNNNDFVYNDQVGDLYYIDDGEKYFKDGKFNRDMLTGEEVDFI